MSLLTSLWEAIRCDPKPSKLLVETVSDRASLVLRCECYKHILMSHGWTDEHLREARNGIPRDGQVRGLA